MLMLWDATLRGCKGDVALCRGRLADDLVPGWQAIPSFDLSWGSYGLTFIYVAAQIRSGKWKEPSSLASMQLKSRKQTQAAPRGRNSEMAETAEMIS